MTTDTNDLFRALFEAIDLGMLVADDSATYVEANRAACELFGRPREALVGCHLSEVVEGARRADVDVQWRAFLRDGVQAGVFTIALPDGSRRELAFQAMANLVPGRHVSFLSPAPVVEDTPRIGSPWTVMCAWTKQIKQGEAWVPLEEYLKQAHGVTITHGISPQAIEELGVGLSNRDDR